ncbi:MAG: AI-2E family transporter [bacterium]
MQNEPLLQRLTLQGIFYALGSLTIAILGLIYFDGIIKPFFIAIILWYVIKEIKNLIGKISVRGKRLPGWWRGFFAMIFIFLFGFGIFELISINVVQMNKLAPEYREKLDNLVQQVGSYINDPQIIQYARQTLTDLDFAGLITAFVNSLSSAVADFTVVFVYVIFLLLEETSFTKKVQKLFPGKGRKLYEFDQIIKKIDKAAGSYVNQMVVISLITAVISYVALLIMGVDFPILWAFLIFILNFIPYIGPFISSLLPAVLAVFQFGDLLYFVYVFAVLEVIQIILGNFVQPKMMGKSLNISALTVLLTLAFWGSIWGVVGMILSVPVTAILIIIMWQIPNTKWLAILLSENGELGG